MGGHFAPLRGSADPKNGHFYSVTSGDLAFDLTEKMTEVLSNVLVMGFRLLLSRLPSSLRFRVSELEGGVILTPPPHHHHHQGEGVSDPHPGEG